MTSITSGVRLSLSFILSPVRFDSPFISILLLRAHYSMHRWRRFEFHYVRVRIITLEARAEWNATKMSVADGKKELNCVLTVQVWKPAAWVFARSLLIRLGFGHGHTCGELVSSSTRLTATASFFFVRSSSSIRSIRTEPTTSYSHPTASTRCECSTVRSTVAAQRKWRSFVMVISTMFFFSSSLFWSNYLWF